MPSAEPSSERDQRSIATSATRCSDNAKFHKCPDVERWLAAHPRLRLHFLPTYAPETNPIERVWWHLHETLTRNHRCHSLDELLDQVLDWLDERTPHAIETSVYITARAA